MKMINAYIRHEAFEPIRTELVEQGIPLAVDHRGQEVRRRKGIVEHYRGSTLTVNVRPKLKLEIVVEDKDKPMVVESILKHARTGEIGDGKISSFPSRKRSASERARGARRSSSRTPRRRLRRSQNTRHGR